MVGFSHPQVADPRKKVRRLYISGPMSGYEEFNYPAFHEAAEALRAAGYEVENPAEIGHPGMAYVDLIREDIRVILDCDGVATLEGWWASRGAHIETSVAGVLNMPIRSVRDWLHER